MSYTQSEPFFKYKKFNKYWLLVKENENKKFALNYAFSQEQVKIIKDVISN